MEVSSNRDSIIDMICKGGKVYSSQSSFTVQKEQEKGVAYQINGLYPSLFANPNITGDELKVWVYLKSLENTQIKGAFPSIETIMKHHKMGKQKLLKILDSLEEKNMLFRLQRKWYDSGKQTSNLYFFNDYNKVTGEFFENGLDALKKTYPNKKALACVYKDNETFEMVLLPDNN